MAGAGGNATALNHQVEGGQTRGAGRQDCQESQLGPQHLLLVTAQADITQITQTGAFPQAQPESPHQPNGDLGDGHAQQQMQGR